MQTEGLKENPAEERKGYTVGSPIPGFHICGFHIHGFTNQQYLERSSRKFQKAKHGFALHLATIYIAFTLH